MIPRRGVKIKFFLSVVIYVVKAAFVPLSAAGRNPAIACVARLCGVSPCPIPDTATALPKQARYQLRNTPIFNKTPLYYNILGRFRKAFLIMVKIVGWLQKRANFRKAKTRKPLCRKALRHFQKIGLAKSYYAQTRRAASCADPRYSSGLLRRFGASDRALRCKALLLYRLRRAVARIIYGVRSVFLRLRYARPSWPRAPLRFHRAAFWRSTRHFPPSRPL